MKNRSLQRPMAGALAWALSWSLAAPGVWAQISLPISPVRPTGLPFLRSYKGVTVPPLRNSSASRLHGMIRSGTLYLSLHDALELAIENSLDLEIARYDVARAPWDVQRAESGGALRGVTTNAGSALRLGSGQGVAGSQASAGGGTGGAGTSSLAGAALIQQIGPVTPQLDPIESLNLGIGHSTSIQTQVVQAGANYFAYDSRSYIDQVSEGLLSGGTVRYVYYGSYLNEAVPLDVLNPTSFIQTGFSISHNLLNGYGVRVNDRFIRLAQKRASTIDLTFRSRAISLAANVLNLYWDLSVADDDVKYKQRNHDLAQELLTDTGLQIAAGAIPAVDQIRAQSNLALQDQALRAARNTAEQRENGLKDVLSWHGRQDPELDAAHIVTTDPLRVPDVEQLQTLSSLVETARKNRPEMIIARSQEEMAATTAYGTANGVLPTLRVGASAYNVGQAGAPVPGQSPTAFFVGGAGNALDQVLQRNFPNESARASFQAKARNSLAQADNAIDQLTHRQSQLARQKTSSELARDIALQRLAIVQAATRYRSARESRQLTEQLLQGEEKKWGAGTSTLASVVQSRRDLANAQSSELAAAAAFVHSQIALDQALGLTLERNDIKVEDALGSQPDGGK
jgi:outer membrane protein TolC